MKKDEATNEDTGEAATVEIKESEGEMVLFGPVCFNKENSVFERM